MKQINFRKMTALIAAVALIVTQVVPAGYASGPLSLPDNINGEQLEPGISAVSADAESSQTEELEFAHEDFLNDAPLSQVKDTSGMVKQVELIRDAVMDPEFIERLRSLKTSIRPEYQPPARDDFEDVAESLVNDFDEFMSGIVRDGVTLEEVKTLHETLSILSAALKEILSATGEIPQDLKEAFDSRISRFDELLSNHPLLIEVDGKTLEVNVSEAMRMIAEEYSRLGLVSLSDYDRLPGISAEDLQGLETFEEYLQLRRINTGGQVPVFQALSSFGNYELIHRLFEKYGEVFSGSVLKDADLDGFAEPSYELFRYLLNGNHQALTEARESFDEFMEELNIPWESIEGDDPNAIKLKYVVEKVGTFSRMMKAEAERIAETYGADEEVFYNMILSKINYELNSRVTALIGRIQKAVLDAGSHFEGIYTESGLGTLESPVRYDDVVEYYETLLAWRNSLADGARNFLNSLNVPQDIAARIEGIFEGRFSGTTWNGRYFKGILTVDFEKLLQCLSGCSVIYDVPGYGEVKVTRNAEMNALTDFTNNIESLLEHPGIAGHFTEAELLALSDSSEENSLYRIDLSAEGEVEASGYLSGFGKMIQMVQLVLQEFGSELIKDGKIDADLFKRALILDDALASAVSDAEVVIGDAMASLEAAINAFQLPLTEEDMDAIRQILKEGADAVEAIVKPAAELLNADARRMFLQVVETAFSRLTDRAYKAVFEIGILALDDLVSDPQSGISMEQYASMTEIRDRVTAINSRLRTTASRFYFKTNVLESSLFPRSDVREAFDEKFYSLMESGLVKIEINGTVYAVDAGEVYSLMVSHLRRLVLDAPGDIGELSNLFQRNRLNNSISWHAYFSRLNGIEASQLGKTTYEHIFFNMIPDTLGKFGAAILANGSVSLTRINETLSEGVPFPVEEGQTIWGVYRGIVEEEIAGILNLLGEDKFESWEEIEAANEMIRVVINRILERIASLTGGLSSAELSRINSDLNYGKWTGSNQYTLSLRQVRDLYNSKLHNGDLTVSVQSGSVTDTVTVNIGQVLSIPNFPYNRNYDKDLFPGISETDFEGTEAFTVRIDLDASGNFSIGVSPYSIDRRAVVINLVKRYYENPETVPAVYRDTLFVEGRLNLEVFRRLIKGIDAMHQKALDEVQALVDEAITDLEALRNDPMTIEDVRAILGGVETLRSEVMSYLQQLTSRHEKEDVIEIEESVSAIYHSAVDVLTGYISSHQLTMTVNGNQMTVPVVNIMNTILAELAQMYPDEEIGVAHFASLFGISIEGLRSYNKLENFLGMQIIALPRNSQNVQILSKLSDIGFMELAVDLIEEYYADIVDSDTGDVDTEQLLKVLRSPDAAIDAAKNRADEIADAIMEDIKDVCEELTLESLEKVKRLMDEGKLRLINAVNDRITGFNDEMLEEMQSFIEELYADMLNVRDGLLAGKSVTIKAQDGSEFTLDLALVEGDVLTAINGLLEQIEPAEESEQINYIDIGIISFSRIWHPVPVNNFDPKDSPTRFGFQVLLARLAAKYGELVLDENGNFSIEKFVAELGRTNAQRAEEQFETLKNEALAELADLAGEETEVLSLDTIDAIHAFLDETKEKFSDILQRWVDYSNRSAVAEPGNAAWAAVMDAYEAMLFERDLQMDVDGTVVTIDAQAVLDLLQDLYDSGYKNLLNLYASGGETESQYQNYRRLSYVNPVYDYYSGGEAGSLKRAEDVIEGQSVYPFTLGDLSRLPGIDAADLTGLDVISKDRLKLTKIDPRDLLSGTLNMRAFSPGSNVRADVLSASLTALTSMRSIVLDGEFVNFVITDFFGDLGQPKEQEFKWLSSSAFNNLSMRDKLFRLIPGMIRIFRNSVINEQGELDTDALGHLLKSAGNILKAVNNLTETLDLSVKDLMSRISSIKVNSENGAVSFQLEEGEMGDARRINTLGDKTLPAFADFTFVQSTGELYEAKLAWLNEDSRVTSITRVQMRNGQIGQVIWRDTSISILNYKENPGQYGIGNSLDDIAEYYSYDNDDITIKRVDYSLGGLQQVLVVVTLSKQQDGKYHPSLVEEPADNHGSIFTEFTWEYVYGHSVYDDVLGKSIYVPTVFKLTGIKRSDAAGKVFTEGSINGDAADLLINDTAHQLNFSTLEDLLDQIRAIEVADPVVTNEEVMYEKTLTELARLLGLTMEQIRAIAAEGVFDFGITDGSVEINFNANHFSMGENRLLGILNGSSLPTSITAGFIFTFSQEPRLTSLKLNYSSEGVPTGQVLIQYTLGTLTLLQGFQPVFDENNQLHWEKSYEESFSYPGDSVEITHRNAAAEIVWSAIVEAGVIRFYDSESRLFQVRVPGEATLVINREEASILAYVKNVFPGSSTFAVRITRADGYTLESLVNAIENGVEVDVLIGLNALNHTYEDVSSWQEMVQRAREFVEEFILKKHEHVESRINELAERLGLSEEQRADIEVISVEFKQLGSSSCLWNKPSTTGVIACTADLLHGYVVQLKLYENTYDFKAGVMDPEKINALAALKALAGLGYDLADLRIQNGEWVVRQDTDPASLAYYFEISDAAGNLWKYVINDADQRFTAWERTFNGAPVFEIQDTGEFGRVRGNALSNLTTGEVTQYELIRHVQIGCPVDFNSAGVPTCFSLEDQVGPDEEVLGSYRIVTKNGYELRAVIGKKAPVVTELENDRIQSSSYDALQLTGIGETEQEAIATNLGSGSINAFVTLLENAFRFDVGSSRGATAIISFTPAQGGFFALGNEFVLAMKNNGFGERVMIRFLDALGNIREFILDLTNQMQNFILNMAHSSDAQDGLDLNQITRIELLVDQEITGDRHARYDFEFGTEQITPVQDDSVIQGVNPAEAHRSVLEGDAPLDSRSQGQYFTAFPGLFFVSGDSQVQNQKHAGLGVRVDIRHGQNDQVKTTLENQPGSLSISDIDDFTLHMQASEIGVAIEEPVLIEVTINAANGKALTRKLALTKDILGYKLDLRSLLDDPNQVRIDIESIEFRVAGEIDNKNKRFRYDVWFDWFESV